MKVYLAGRYGDLPILRDVAYLLLMAGHHVTSRWLMGNSSYRDMPAERAEMAKLDWEDIRGCDQFVLYSHLAPAMRQGHSVELGIVLGRRGNYDGSVPRVVIVGERTDNIFHWLEQIEHFPNWYLYFDHMKVPGELLGQPPLQNRPVEITMNQSRSIDAEAIQSWPN